MSLQDMKANRETLRLLAILAGMKAAYLLLLLGTLVLWSDLDRYQFDHAYQRWPREGGPIFASHFATWDTAHYLYLTEVGYSAGAWACAFYPLWPLTVQTVTIPFGGDYLIVGLVLANICSLAAWLLFHTFVARRWGRGAANWSLAFLIAFPGSLFFQFNYTESPFLLLILCLWWALENRRYGSAWIAGSLLPLTRAIGVFAILPIAWHVLKPALQRWHRGRQCEPGHGVTAEKQPSSGSFNPFNLFNLFNSCCAQPLWLFLAPLWGWALYLTLMWHWTGNPFEGFDAQKHWGAHSIGNLWNLPKFLVALFTPTTWHDFKGSALDRVVFLFIAATIPALGRLDKGLLVWLYMLAVLPAMSGHFTSFTRFASCAFPVFIALGVSFARPELKWRRFTLLGLLAIVHLVLLWRFVNFRWAG